MKSIFLKGAMLFIQLTLLSSILLWITRAEDLPSQSTFANQPNVLWYISLHSGMILSFFILNATQGIKKWVYGAVAFASGLTLMFDMYGYSLPHNISTALIFSLASYCIIAYEDPVTDYLSRKFYMIICGVLGILFLSSVLKVIHISVYLIETIIEWVFGFIIMYRIKNLKT